MEHHRHRHAANNNNPAPPPDADNGFYCLSCPAHTEICLLLNAEASELLLCALLVMQCICPDALASPPVTPLWSGWQAVIACIQSEYQIPASLSVSMHTIACVAFAAECYKAPGPMQHEANL